MKLQVLIERPRSGILRAFVVQEGVKGTNLLSGRQITNIETAKKAVLKKLPDLATIEFVGVN